jgi:hypothetical protein
MRINGINKMTDAQFAALAQRVNDLRVEMIRNETSEIVEAFFKAKDKFDRELARRQLARQQKEQKQK